MAPHWRRARLIDRRPQTDTGRTLVFDTAAWPGHAPGQHVDVRLTADDGYQAVRSYSLAAPADGDRIELGVQSASGGEVSPYLADLLPVGADVEIRGPLGGWFVWRPAQRDAVLLVAGGSGIVPLMAMVRAHRAAASTTPCHLVYCVRDPAQVWYRAELAAAGPAVQVDVLYTRQAPDGSARPAGRIGPADLPAPDAAGEPPLCFLCGPTGFVEHVGALLLDRGHPADRIRTERFG
ncbi:ferredoxin reductase [Streptomyces macrosporus]|uniref:Ferredoxin reductase n=1 Tax=Streptomyces macrosporus TaxID=44032 RepID=A0ABN3JIY3_9ACTN